MKLLNPWKTQSLSGKRLGEGALVCVLLFASATFAAPLYSIVPLGLDDLEHTRNDGYKFSSVWGMNEAGHVNGYSSRFNGSTDLGQSTWFYSGATTINIGLVGSEHTSNNGYKHSYPQQKPNEAGQVIGGSYRYNGGGNSIGTSAWLYQGATTIDIGLIGTEHTRNDGYKDSYSGQLNQAGQVVGSSTRYKGGSTDLGTSVWLYNGSTTINIGLTGPEHTYSVDYKKSYSGGLNEAGQVVGYAERANGGSTWLGYSAWLYNGTATIDIGLTGSEYTTNDGYKYSIAFGPNEAGRVVGYSHRFNGGSVNLGVTAWIYDGATPIDIGLTDSEHTSNNGEKTSQPQELSQSGKVIGYAYRFNGGSTSLGKTAWLYDGATTIATGLIGAEHTRNDGYKESFFDYNNGVDLLNEAGHVAGTSYRYNGGSTQLGQSV